MPALLADCVGDTTVTPDSGSDASTADSAPDQKANEAGVDAGDAGDAAVDAGDAGVEAGFTHAFVANLNNGSGGSLNVFNTPLSGASTSVLSLNGTNGLGAPAAVRLDPTATKLWIADSGKTKIYAFTLPLSSTSTPAVTLTPANQPTDIQFDSNGNLWVAEFSGTCERWNTPITGASALKVTTGGSNVFAIALDASNNLYAGQGSSPGLAYFSAPQTNNATPTFTNANFPASTSGLAIGGGKIYAGSYVAGTLVSASLPINSSTTTTAIKSGYNVWRLSFSPTNELIVPGFAANTVAFLAPPGYTTTNFSLANGLSDPRGLDFGP